MEAESKRFYLFGGWLMSQRDLAAGIVAARARPSAAEPGPADNSRTAQGQTFRRCVSAAVSKAPTATGVAAKNDRSA